MTAEILSSPGENLSPSRPEYKTPVMRILESPGAERVFCDFMWQFVGNAHTVDRNLRGYGKGFPAVERTSLDGQEQIAYMEPLVSGYTQLGRLVHVRINWNRPQTHERYLVIIGDLETETLKETVVNDVSHVLSTDGKLETVLYLHDDEYEATGWPKEFGPTIRMTQQGFYYCPGGDRREEQLVDAGVLATACAAAQPIRHLHAVD